MEPRSTMSTPSDSSQSLPRPARGGLARRLLTSAWLTRRETQGLLAGASVLTVWYVAPNLWVAAIAAAAFFLVAARSPLAGAVWVIWTAPWFRFPKSVDAGGLGEALLGRTAAIEMSLVEFTILLTFAAWLARHAWLYRTNAARSAVHPSTGPPAEPFDRALRPRSGEPQESPRRALGRTDAVADRPNSWRWWRDALISPLGLLLAAATLSLTWSELLRFSLREYRTIIVEPALFALVVRDIARERRAWWLLLWSLIAVGGVAAGFALWGFFSETQIVLADGVRRASAIYGSPNHLALLLGRIAPAAGALALAAPLTMRAWSPLLVVVMAMTAALALTYSRGAWFGYGAALLFLAAVDHRRAFRMLALVGGAVALGTIFLVPLDRLASETTSGQRLYVWQAAARMIMDYPLTGVGLDNFLYQYPRYMLVDAWREPNLSHPHNIILDFWVQLGILGLTTLGWMQLRFWRQARAVWLRRDDAWNRAGALALMASMADFLAHGLIDNSFFLIDTALVFWLTAMLMERLLREEVG